MHDELQPSRWRRYTFLDSQSRVISISEDHGFDEHVESMWLLIGDKNAILRLNSVITLRDSETRVESRPRLEVPLRFLCAHDFFKVDSLPFLFYLEQLLFSVVLL